MNGSKEAVSSRVTQQPNDGDSKRLLYVDAANFTTKFFPLRQRWNLKSASKNVKLFCHAVTASRWTMVAFLDQAAMTAEAQVKWRTRRQREVRKGERKVPQGALRLLGDMLAENGVGVRYSTEADNDDTLASHAHVDGASILSQDSDFLRYRNANYDIYKDFTIHKGKLVLVKQDTVRKASWRNIIVPPPATGESNPFRECFEENTYVRGSPSPLVQLGNLHVHVRPLRAALYAHLQLDEVEEEFPVLGENKTCIWDKQVVRADESCAELLLSPEQAVKQFHQARPDGSSDDDWVKHQFALRSIIAELCCTVSGSALLSTLRPLMESMEVPPPTRRPKKKKNSPKTGVNKSTRPERAVNKEMDTDTERTGKAKANKPKSSHYLTWRESQKTGESNKEKRERYLKLFPRVSNPKVTSSAVDSL